MDERERLEQYLAWRRAQGKDRRGRIYHRLRIAGAAAAFSLLGVTLVVAIGGWPRPAERDVAPVPTQSRGEALPGSLPAAPSSEAAGPATPNPVSSETAPAGGRPRPSVSSAARRTSASERAPLPAVDIADERPPVSDNAPAASPGHDGSSEASPSEPASGERAPTVIVEPPATPMPTVIVEPPPAPEDATATPPGPATSATPGTSPARPRLVW
jgi:hypothetical protein